VFTNLTARVEILLDVVRQHPPERVITSLESSDPIIHDAFRGVKGSHARTVAAIVALAEQNVPITVNLVVGSHNVDGVEATLGWLKTLAVTTVVDFVRLQGRAKRSLLLDPKGYSKLRAALRNHLNSDLSYIPLCGVGGEMLYVAANGSVRACPSLQQPEFEVGQLGSREFRIENCVGAAARVCAPLLHPNCEPSCEVWSRCRGGCRANALLATGSPDGVDAAACDLLREGRAVLTDARSGASA
jgi:radical SAM protein with 4Fe4S-binding SPASM domain